MKTIYFGRSRRALLWQTDKFVIHLGHRWDVNAWGFFIGIGQKLHTTHGDLRWRWFWEWSSPPVRAIYALPPGWTLSGEVENHFSSAAWTGREKQLVCLQLGRRTWWWL